MPVMQSPPGASTVIDGRPYLYFAGTGYLGLQGREEVIRAACEATARYGIGSATSRSRTGFGDTPPVVEVERRAAEFFGQHDAFYFMSGYIGANILTETLGDAFDAVFIDELSHYCLFEAARLSGKPVLRFRHRDADDLRATLNANLAPGQRPLLLCDGVFAAKGTIAPLADYRAVLADYPGAAMCIDDAHGLGVLGRAGRGSFEHARLWPAGVNRDVAELRDAELPDAGPRQMLCGTLSKAMGGFGGIIAGTGRFIERLKNTSHYYSGASPPPVPAAAASARALELVAAEPRLRVRLRENAAVLKNGLRKMGISIDDTPVPIACLAVGDAANMQRIQRELMRRDICIAYFASYAGLGPEGALRIAVFATHTEQMIGQLLDELARIV